jgi:biotin synthase
VLNPLVNEVGRRVLEGGEATPQEALQLIGLEGEDLYDLFLVARKVCRRFKGREVFFCSIVNAKSGLCPEDCAFCAQSVHASADIETFPMRQPEYIIEQAQAAVAAGANEFSIVTSGKAPNRGDLDAVCEALGQLKAQNPLVRCASLGVLNEEKAARLKAAGLQSYHHNLETSRRFFPQICSTHEYEESVETVRLAKRHGFSVCCGGIFGMGETDADRVELAFTLRELDVDSVPLNFLNPIAGTQMENQPPLPPLKILAIISIYRLVLPSKDILVCGGREVNLRDLQPLIFLAGANGTMLGHYLTTKGRAPEEDLRMIADLGLEAVDENEA